jgi:hypothetical protein
MTNVIAASSGSGFGPDNSDSGSASNGFWHGYTVIRIEPDGGVAVEQRPVLDWVTIQAAEHTLQPGQHMLLHGVGREPVGISSGNTNTLQLPTPPSLRYDEIDSPAITHRYDLVEADPARPWLPKVDPGSPAPNHYVPLDPSVATVDRETGFVRAGSGSHPRVYAIAILSVGDQAASWPIAFEPSRAFVQRKPTLPQLPPVIPPPALPPVHLAAAAPTPPPPPSSAPPTPPEIGSPMFPQLPSLSPPPPVAAVAPPAPPPPPNAPPPPAQPQPLPLALQAKLSPVGINATVVPPSPPPVNPAPPSGSAARKEAKQRQAATAKSEEGGAEQARDAGVDLAGGPRMPEGTAQMTRNSAPFSRRDRDRPQPSITPMARSAQLSAWTRDLLYGGGISGGALLLAFGFATIRPRSRRRSTPAPARAWARSR